MNLHYTIFTSIICLKVLYVNLVDDLRTWTKPYDYYTYVSGVDIGEDFLNCFLLFACEPLNDYVPLLHSILDTKLPEDFRVYYTHENEKGEKVVNEEKGPFHTYEDLFNTLGTNDETRHIRAHGDKPSRIVRLPPDSVHMDYSCNNKAIYYNYDR